MKILKSLLLVSVGLSATALLQAQELKTQVLKQSETKAPPASTESNKPSPLPQLKPMGGIVPAAAPVAASQTPSPLKKDESGNQVNQPKKATATTDANATENKLTTEQLNTLNGTAQRPKQTTPVAALDAQTAKPQILAAPSIAPVAVKEQ